MFSASINRWIDAMVADEHGGGQSSDVVISAVVTAKQSGVIAGQCVIDRLIQRHFASCMFLGLLKKEEEPLLEM
jgi:hypothetical protein